ncbi:hypothetical protein Ancab_014847 [Ancistrocladus abbreviatus]
MDNENWAKDMGYYEGVMALTTQKVEEYSKESGPDNSKIDSSHQNENERDGYHQDFNHDTKGWNPSGVRQSSGQQFNSISSGSWDDWDQREHGKVGSTNGVASHGNDGWAGWDDAKDDGFENFYQGASDKKATGHNEKSDVFWTGGGFF